MKYQIGSQGRIIVIRFDDRDDLIEGLESIAKKEDIRAGLVYVIGGMRKAKIVVGPEKDDLPPEPMWRALDEPNEILAVGTVFYDADAPKVHIHGAFARGDTVRVGCLRELSETFLVIEAVIMEIKGVSARREFDPASGLKLLKLA
ncbi:MAG: DNA-binding protein [Nitrospirae bacterium]|nr:DNA-binding protein [Nitrospirota bacterium]